MRCLVLCKRGAFTLIEMLISILLLTLIIATMMFGFKQSINELQRTQSITPHKVLEYSQMASAIKGMFPYVVEVQEGFEDKKLKAYIKTQPQLLEFISKNPIYGDEISIIKLECIEEQLIYYEKPLYSMESNYLEPKIEEEDKKKSFFKKLESCQFSYQFASIRNTPSLITLTLKPINKEALEYRFAPMVDFNNTRLIYIVNEKVY